MAAAPLYLLRRDEELFFGGSTGVVADTLGSLLRGVAYGTPVAPAAIDLAAWAVPAALILPLVLVAPPHDCREGSGSVPPSRWRASWRCASPSR